MCDNALSLARDHLLPLARDHLLPLLLEAADMIRGVPREVADLKAELESIEDFINDADRMAEAEEGNTRDGMKARVKQLTEAAFHIEDVIDEYMISEGQDARDPGCAAAVADLLKTVILRLQIAYKIQNIKSRIGGMKDTSGRDGSQTQSSSEQGPSSSVANQNAALLQNLRDAPLYMDEDDVVGFEAPIAKLIGWLVNGRAERTVISVVGMGGQGKTTLTKKVFDNKEVIEHFDCRAWITVSLSYTVEGLLRDMLREFYKQKGEDPPHGIFRMDRRSLINEVRNYLQQKRYIIVFDDVWNVHFWNEIEFSVIKNKNGSKILITTRKMDVAQSCKKSSFVEVHELQRLTQERSLKLFNKKAFFDLNERCPKNLMNISSEIVNKCEGLPLAIVAIGGLLSIKDRDAVQWKRFSENLSLELKKDSHLIGIKRILGFSYNDLSYNLKSCLLYFGIYPEDYVVKSKRLIRQWIAEGFVKEERGKTLEEVAEGYLTELIHRSLVQVSSITIDGKAKGCRVHDLLRVLILEKFEDLSFCQHTSEDSQSSLSGIIRRLSIVTNSNDSLSSIENSHVRSLLIFTNKKLSEYFVRKITTTYKLLKVLDFEGARWFSAPTRWSNVPKNLGSLIHLKYLSLRYEKVAQSELLKSISMLQNLETLDLRDTGDWEMPKEISKLRKLRHLLGNKMSLIQLKDGIGGMTFLQTLFFVVLDGDGVVELIRELGKLKQLRKLGLHDVRGEHGSTLSSSLNEMQHLETLHIVSKPSNEVIDFHFISSPPKLRNLRLYAKLEQLPKWITKLQNLVKLTLAFSQLTDDLMKSLRNMQNLLYLSISNHAYEGESLHFQDGVLQKLKELYLRDSDNLNSIIIDKGALHYLQKLELWNIPQLKTVPTGIQHLQKLEVLSIQHMPTEFVQSIAPDRGKEHWMIEHVPHVKIDTIHSKVMRAGQIFTSHKQ